MKLRIALGLVAALAPAALAAESWKEVDRLPGDIALELDEDSVSAAMDGTSEVLLATFRRQMPTGIMESDVALDCAKAMAKLRGIRLVNGSDVYRQPVPLTAGFHEVGFGSADAIYYKVLCGKDVPLPEGYVADEAPVLEDPAAADENAHPLVEDPVLGEPAPAEAAGQ